MSKNTKLRISDLDFDSIKAGFINYLSSQPEFTDYNFEASGLSSIIDLLSYNTHYTSLMSNFSANEMFIDTAVKRTSVVSLAKALGYTPRSSTAAKAIINMTIYNIFGEPSSWALPVGTRFSTTINNKAYSFCTKSAYATNKNSSDNSYTFSNIEVFEGQYVENIVTWTGTDPTIGILNQNIDTSTLRIWVKKTNEDYEEYSLGSSVLNANENSKIYFVQEGFNGWEIYFGDGILGYKPDTPTQIKMSYIATTGSEGNNAVNFSLVSSLGQETASSTYAYSTSQKSAGGADAETVSSIKLHALNYFGSQNRAVITSDYVAIIQKLGVNTKNVLVWGGEDNTPPKFGTVMICIEPVIGDYITDSDKAIIEASLKTKAVANTKFEFIAPEYIDIVVDCTVNYNLTTLSMTTYDLEVIVKNTIEDYAITNLTSFDSAFRYSNLSTKIDLSDDAILSNLMKIKLLKKFVIGNIETSISTEFNNVLSVEMSSASISSNYFRLSGQSDTMWIEDDKHGNLNGYSVINGEKKAILTNIGTVNYNTGSVSVMPLKYSWIDGTHLKIYAIPSSNNIFSQKNSIVRLTTDNIFVQTTATG